MKRNLGILMVFILLLNGCQKNHQFVSFKSKNFHVLSLNPTNHSFLDPKEEVEEEIIEEIPSIPIIELPEAQEPVEEQILPLQPIEEEEVVEETIPQQELHPRNKESDIAWVEDKINIYVFWGNGCSHCEELFSFFESLDEEILSLFQLYGFETWEEEKNHVFMNELASLTDTPASGVPYMLIGSEVFLGYDTSINEKIIETIQETYHSKEDLYEKYLHQN